MKYLLFFLLAFVFAASCSSPTELSGEVFVTGRDNQPIKLSLVTVAAYRAEDVERKIAEMGDSLTRALDEIDSKSFQCSGEEIFQCQRDTYIEVDRVLDQVTGSLRAAASATSDSTGAFTLKLPSKEPYVLRARSSRSIKDGLAHYIWFNRTDPKNATKALLSQAEDNNWLPPTANLRIELVQLRAQAKN